jgi:hypothetical protein
MLAGLVHSGFESRFHLDPLHLQPHPRFQACEVFAVHVPRTSHFLSLL